MITFLGQHNDTAAVKQEHSTPKKGKYNSDCDRMTLARVGHHNYTMYNEKLNTFSEDH